MAGPEGSPPVLEDAVLVIVTAIFAMLPAYVANPVAVLTGGGTPMDMGRNWSDGRRILGDGKTWRGLAGGTIGGMGLAGILSVAVRASGNEDLTTFMMPGWEGGLSWLYVGFLLAFGALMGDFTKSFFKRRSGRERGSKSPVMDMYDFVAGSWLLTALLAWGWFSDVFSVWHILVILVVTPALHRSVNILGYKMGKKDVPW
jgi:CDP-2,3-bis-(O-geranylgeranyl)-sn-glycerol synthase